MAKHWEMTGRLGELQVQWLRAHCTEEQLAEGLYLYAEEPKLETDPITNGYSI